ncbi:mitochondrial import inner membrane translocase subunit TIM50-like [Vigna umbellata]|uniref:mitochondrial import inner membrane translocase subunit TIM50-like n=1 Tax=Vigna umbellata TaxID=87088 RepID=UPI001F5E4B1C|nr:mitochondrial import inner membrane translocase subunit TIM50-like [Vigna umbellata]
MDFYVLKLLGVDEFLETLVSKYEAGPESVHLTLDLCGSCRHINEKIVKDLNETGHDLKRVVIVDDNPNSFSNQPKDAIMIRPFVDDIFDRELWKLRSFFDGSDCCNDMRDVVRRY